MDVGPFVLPSGDPRYVAALKDVVKTRLPWHTLAGVRVLANDTQWPVTSHQGTTIYMPAGWAEERLRETLAHEAAHAFDKQHLTDAERGAIHIFLDGSAPCGHTWGIRDGTSHHQAASEAFAAWWAHHAGFEWRTRYGPHDWSDEQTRNRILEVVMAAAERVQIFADVPPDSTHAEGIHWAAGRGLIEGYPDGTFRPDDYVTRGQLATVLNAALEERK